MSKNKLDMDQFRIRKDGKIDPRKMPFKRPEGPNLFLEQANSIRLRGVEAKIADKEAEYCKEISSEYERPDTREPAVKIDANCYYCNKSENIYPSQMVKVNYDSDWVFVCAACSLKRSK